MTISSNTWRASSTRSPASGDYLRTKACRWQGRGGIATARGEGQHSVATSLLGVGTFPSPILSISWGGMHGEAYCNYALQECDVRLRSARGWMTASPVPSYISPPRPKIIHVDALIQQKWAKSVHRPAGRCRRTLTLRACCRKSNRTSIRPGWGRSTTGARIPSSETF